MLRLIRKCAFGDKADVVGAEAGHEGGGGGARRARRRPPLAVSLSHILSLSLSLPHTRCFSLTHSHTLSLRRWRRCSCCRARGASSRRYLLYTIYCTLNTSYHTKYTTYYILYTMLYTVSTSYTVHGKES